MVSMEIRKETICCLTIRMVLDSSIGIDQSPEDVHFTRIPSQVEQKNILERESKIMKHDGLYDDA